MIRPIQISRCSICGKPVDRYHNLYLDTKTNEILCEACSIDKRRKQENIIWGE